MKFLDRFTGVGYRVLTPRWAYAPASGAGAGQFGGRANRPGVEALYLSASAQTAIAEYQQLSALMPPGTLVNFEIDIGPVADFTQGYEPSQWEPLWEDFHCDWRSLWFHQKVEPPSWVLGDMAVAAGAKGLLFSSKLAAGPVNAVNLVVYTQSLDASDTIKLFDPQQVLPKNADSWK